MTYTVPDSREIRRVLSLPRRDPYTDVEQHVNALNCALVRDPSRAAHGKISLRKDQAVVLSEALALGGFFGGLGTGTGKTLLTRLLPVVFGTQRPVLVTLANLIDKTHREFTKYEAEWFCSGPRPHVISYEWLRHKNQHGWLVEYAPDLLMLDEGHAVKNPQATTTKRIVAARRAFPQLPIVILTGTPGDTVFEYSHLCRLALGDDLSPFPNEWFDLDRWRAALDRDVVVRGAPGALERFRDKSDPPGLEGTRRAVGRRLRETPGVLLSSDETVGASLMIDAWSPPLCRPVAQALRDLRSLWRLPDGTEICDALEFGRQRRSLAFGYYRRPKSPPPKEWLAARARWSQFARAKLQRNRQGIDALSILVDEIRVGRVKDGGILAAWEAQAATYELVTEPVWISDKPVAQIAERLRAEPAIAWIDSIPLGVALRDHGLIYYADGGLDERGNYIEAESGQRSIVASRAANKTGRNLQMFSRNLLLCTPDEQLLARTHRSGQRAGQVTATLYASTPEHFASFWRAVDAALATQEFRGVPQKLGIADIAFERDAKPTGEP